jgi:hypothetical protein
VLILALLCCNLWWFCKYFYNCYGETEIRNFFEIGLCILFWELYISNCNSVEKCPCAWLFSHPILVFVLFRYLAKITTNYLTNQQLHMWSGALLVKKLHPFMQPKNTLLCPDKFISCPYLQPGEFSLYHPPCFCIWSILILSYQVFWVVSYLYAYKPTVYVHLSSYPFMSHAQHISSSLIWLP